ncbi:transcriptional pleiotropic regulator of transition state genes [Hydrogenoanaerobacterium saccharovorans]|uniref:Transcriptional pleiotropic regulator of transition state genes n=1 Tax=Hydrogenoanaerobacterium saccharovorans TaxID=474960 RepID=A0A1H8CXV9_9FIRM|nr:hypothetical protein [Hydrogenoanaerobacterium saccharovorans]RPF43375.1 transcriptional pleiotropic regulator of transition state genes [Hydrogenoanaerobacterium saccharovorans]SEM99835.1 transcriptional pleiotropic regulator of transition state genes [Hydrogenoanaerobacterium saccharovorans]
MSKARITDPKIENTITKPIDEVGRIHIPIMFYKRIGVQYSDKVMVTSTDDAVIITPKKHVCYLCGSQKDIQKCGEKYFCKSCIEEIAKQKDE